MANTPEPRPSPDRTTETANNNNQSKIKTNGPKSQKRCPTAGALFCKPFKWIWFWISAISSFIWTKIAYGSKTTWRALSQQFSRVSHWAQNLKFVVWYLDKFPGWKAGVVGAISVATLILCSNSAFLIWAIKRDNLRSNGLGTAVEGDCDAIGTWNKVGHGVINVLSTCLLGLSNYCMQLLASPTRGSVDKAHRKRQWVDIGIQSFRNIWKRHISPWRTICWLLLAMSSAPLHLLWNSVIMFSPSAFRYNTIAVTEGFTRGLPFDDTVLYSLSDSDEEGAHWPDNIHFLQQDLPSYENLSNIECKRAYAKNFIQDRGDVVVVIKPIREDVNSSTVLGSATGGFGEWPYKWLCLKESSHTFKCYREMLNMGNKWIFPRYEDVGNEVQYCLSKRMKERCKLEYGISILIIVVVANAIKVICFGITYWIMTQHTSRKIDESNNQHGNTLLVTTGDAVASFLEVPDRTTVGISLAEKEDFRNGLWDHRWSRIEPMLWLERERCMSFRAIGVQRWWVGSFLLAIIPIVPGFFLIRQFKWFTNELHLNTDAFTQLGIGSPSPLFLFGAWSSAESLTSTHLLQNVILANTPQLIISIAYFIWNGHLTAMVAAREYDQFAAPISNKQKGRKRFLRVTNPIEGSGQKSTRFLTIPFKYWAPNTAVWTALHWSASQAIFFARVDILDHWLEITNWSISQVGYSVLGLVCFVAIATVAFCFGIWIGLLRLDNRMPLAATCSSALSAACHPQDPKLEHYKKEVYWGIELFKGKKKCTDGDHEVSQIGHCTFTSLDAHYPEEGVFYA